MSAGPPSPAATAAPATPLARAPQASRRSARLGSLAVDIAVQSLVLVALGCLWETISRLGLVNSFMLPALSDVVGRIGEDVASGSLFTDIGLTVYRALSGFAIAAAIGVPLGVLMARVGPVRWFFDPIVSIGFPMPKIAFLPILVLWFDIFDTSKIIMVALSSIFPVIAAANAGTLGVDRWPIWSARSFGVGERRILWQVIVPMALPQILTGLQIALPIAMITTIVTEMLTGGEGVGGRMITAGRFADSVGVFAGIVEIAILGILLTRGLALLRARLLVWHAESR